jgi:hypothetical protein
MARTWRVGRSPLLLGHGLLMLSLGVALCCLGSNMSDPAFIEPGNGIATALTVLCLLIPVAFFWVLPQRFDRRRTMALNVLVASSLMGCWLILWLLQSSPSDLQFLVLLGGLHGVFWSMWYMKLASTFHENAKKASLLCVLAATTSLPGIVLATQSRIGILTAVTELAWYALFVGIQILLTSMYLYRESQAETGLQAERVLQALPIQEDSRARLTPRIGNRGERIEEGLRFGAD